MSIENFITSNLYYMTILPFVVWSAYKSELSEYVLYNVPNVCAIFTQRNSKYMLYLNDHPNVTLHYRY